MSDFVLRPGAEPIPGYRLISRLGRGGFGEVWKAEKTGGYKVALKFLTLNDVTVIEKNALEMITSIQHPNLLTPNMHWLIGDCLVFEMVLADGGTLKDCLDEARSRGLGGIPREELLDYMAEAAKGVDFLNAHRHNLGGDVLVGIQHRDLKPQNILLVGNGVKVADFGLARLLERESTGHTGYWTAAYAAPEFFDQKTTDYSDQYSLAVTYCILRGGRLPFEGTLNELIFGHIGKAPNLSMLPEGEQAVVGRALSKEPTARWRSCREFVEMLRLTDPFATRSWETDGSPAGSSGQGMPFPAPNHAQASSWEFSFVEPASTSFEIPGRGPESAEPAESLDSTEEIAEATPPEPTDLGEVSSEVPPKFSLFRLYLVALVLFYIVTIVAAVNLLR